MATLRMACRWRIRWQADAVDHPLVFEPEGGPSDEALAWNVLTWGQYKFGFVPNVDRYRWLEPRHQVNISDRWNRDKTDDLQFAFFNGEGWESWENIWGIWNGITPRDAEATRRVAAIERATAPFYASESWRPLYPMQQYGVFASQWPMGGKNAVDDCQSQRIRRGRQADVGRCRHALLRSLSRCRIKTRGGDLVLPHRGAWLRRYPGDSR